MNIEPGKVYRNIKNRKLYLVQSIGLHTELKELHVHYVPLYKSEYKNYYRPLSGPTGFRVKFEEADDEG